MNLCVTGTQGALPALSASCARWSACLCSKAATASFSGLVFMSWAPVLLQDQELRQQADARRPDGRRRHHHYHHHRAPHDGRRAGPGHHPHQHYGTPDRHDGRPGALSLDVPLVARCKCITCAPRGCRTAMSSAASVLCVRGCKVGLQQAGSRMGVYAAKLTMPSHRAGAAHGAARGAGDRGHQAARHRGHGRAPRGGGGVDGNSIRVVGKGLEDCVFRVGARCLASAERYCYRALHARAGQQDPDFKHGMGGSIQQILFSLVP